MANSHAFFVDYVKATAAKDEARLKAHLELLIMPLNLPNSCQTLNPNLNKAALVTELGHHVEHLTKAFENYDSAYSSLRMVYFHMTGSCPLSCHCNPV
ncbi:hypothetical protein ACT8ZS_23380 [Paenibacillus sp. M.A.Huq-84]